MAYQVEVVGLKELMRDVARAGGDAKPLVKAAITNSVNKVQANARKNALHKTGTLQRSIITQVIDLLGIVQVNEKYGIWVEEGTGIYGPTGTKITPRTAKALAFTYMGKKVVVKSVKGMKPHPFFKPGIDESEAYIQNQFDQVTERLVNEMAGRA